MRLCQVEMHSQERSGHGHGTCAHSVPRASEVDPGAVGPDRRLLLAVRLLWLLPQLAPQPLQGHLPHEEGNGKVTPVPVSVIAHVLLEILTQKVLIEVGHLLCIQRCSLA